MQWSCIEIISGKIHHIFVSCSLRYSPLSGLFMHIMELSHTARLKNSCTEKNELDWQILWRSQSERDFTQIHMALRENFLSCWILTGATSKSLHLNVMKTGRRLDVDIIFTSDLCCLSALASDISSSTFRKHSEMNSEHIGNLHLKPAF